MGVCGSVNICINAFFTEVHSTFEVISQLVNQLADSPRDIGDIKFYQLVDIFSDEFNEKGLDSLIEELSNIKESEEYEYIRNYRNANIHHFDQSGIHSQPVGGDRERDIDPDYDFIDLTPPLNPEENWWDWQYRDNSQYPPQVQDAGPKLEELKEWYDGEVRQLVEGELSAAFEEIFDLT